MKTSSFKAGQVVRFTHRGEVRLMRVEEIRRGCVRGYECMEGGKLLPEMKKWRKRPEQCEVVS